MRSENDRGMMTDCVVDIGTSYGPAFSSLVIFRAVTAKEAWWSWQDSSTPSVSPGLPVRTRPVRRTA